MADRHAVFSRSMTGLVPANEAAHDALRGVTLGSKLKVQVSRPRNIAHHNLYWALCTKIAAAIPGDYTAENISDVLKIKAGHCDTVRTRDGLVMLPRSIAWSKMDQAAFGSFYERCLVIICQQWLPHLRPSDLRDELEQMVAA